MPVRRATAASVSSLTEYLLSFHHVVRVNLPRTNRIFSPLFQKSADFYFYGCRLRFLILREVHFKHAILEFGAQLVARDAFGQRETPSERPIAPLNAMVLFVLFLFFNFPLPRY